MAKKGGQTKVKDELSDSDEAVIQNLFKFFTKEKRKDGKENKKKYECITEKQLRMGLRVAFHDNPTESEIRQIYKDLDIKPGDEISYAKFHQMMANYIHSSKHKSQEERKQEMLRAFKVFDKNGDEKIDKVELKHFLMTNGDKLTDKEAEEMFRLVDVNKDGKIDCNEFVKMFSK